MERRKVCLDNIKMESHNLKVLKDLMHTVDCMIESVCEEYDCLAELALIKGENYIDTLMELNMPLKEREEVLKEFNRMMVKHLINIRALLARSDEIQKAYSDHGLKKVKGIHYCIDCEENEVREPYYLCGPCYLEKYEPEEE